ncbi:outer membrane beta-barrel protein [Leptobacterium flavescens]|uniref:Outer membrane beta-barrel protein n=1 Tax=Leptobacterium flavescens TaxID=472055 RepID=A0A6P0UI85_9FLAO|nr:outer membrane beta-barrel protein [Leptobacterium flavescens]NER13005.1 outer membrane beta-barrel protein [Leptobacterium flavescens]
MKGGKKDIGRAVKERLSDVHLSPKESVWDNIEKELDKKRKRRFLIWLFPAAGLLIFLAVFALWPEEQIPSQEGEPINTEHISSEEMQSIREKTTPADSDIVTDKDSPEESIMADKDPAAKNPQLISSSENRRTTGRSLSSKDRNAHKDDNSFKRDENPDTNATTDTQETAKKQKLTVVETEEKDSLVEKTPVKPGKKKRKPVAKAKEDVKKEEEKEEKFHITFYAAPTVLNPLTKRSILHENLDNNSQQNEIALSYGGYLKFNLSNKFGLRFGAGLLNLKTTTNNVAVLNEGGTPADILGLSISAVPGRNNAEIANFFNGNPVDLRQEIAYLEIPVEFYYLLINKKIKLDAIGGFGLLFLTENSIYAEGANGSLLLGEADNLSKASVSINLGVGLHYDISERIRFNLEPIFKYQIKARDNSPNTANLYSFGIYTGFSFKF